MRKLDRVVALLVGLLLLGIWVGFMWQSLGVKALDSMHLDRLLYLLGQHPLRILFTSLVLLILAAYLFWMGLRRRRPEKTILCDTPLGEVRIAERAVESLALRASRRVKGVHDANISVRATIAGLDIFVEATVGPDQSIPQITQEIRTRVAEYIRETVGVSVNTVAVFVTRIAPENRARVE